MSLTSCIVMFNYYDIMFFLQDYISVLTKNVLE